LIPNMLFHPSINAILYNIYIQIPLSTLSTLCLVALSPYMMRKVGISKKNDFLEDERKVHDEDLGDIEENELLVNRPSSL